MRDRCLLKTHFAYKNYGARGISVCQAWRESFINFFEHMGKRPSDKHELDRIDNDGDYKPGNTRWSLVKENARNRNRKDGTGPRYYKHNGRLMCLTEIAEVEKLNYGMLYSRMNSGWELEAAISVKPNRANCRDKLARSIKQGSIFVNYNGTALPYTAVAGINGIRADTAWRRYHLYGWSLEEAVGITKRNKDK
jgi:hypothetical protein